MTDNDRVTHGDILHILGKLEGKLEGKLDSVYSAIGTSREDIGEAFRKIEGVSNRIGLAEQRIAQGVLLAAVLSVITPIITTFALVMLSPRIEFGPNEPSLNHSSKQ